MEELKDIGRRRRQLGLKQVELARLAGVSQSLIAKVERGKIDLAYSKAQEIFRALERGEKLSSSELIEGIHVVDQSRERNDREEAPRRQTRG